FGYSSLVVIPTTIAFLLQIRHAYDEYLAKVLPSLNEEQPVATTSKRRELTVPRGATITRQGDPADRFYILTHGEADVIHVSVDGEEKVLSKIGPGQYFGEIGLLQGGQRTATVRASTDVTAMSLDRETFGALMMQSEISRGGLERIVRQRLGGGEDAGNREGAHFPEGGEEGAERIGARARVEANVGRDAREHVIAREEDGLARVDEHGVIVGVAWRPHDARRATAEVELLAVV